MARRGVLGLLAVGMTVSSSGCGTGTKRASYRFRITVDAATRQGLVSGSAIWQINAAKRAAFTSEERGGGTALWGEAVVIDVAPKPLFVLLRPVDDAGELLAVSITKALDPAVKPLDPGAFVDAVQELSRRATTAKLPPQAWPMIVQFDDITDPRTFRLVEPEAVGITRIWLETTGDALTRGIEERIAWINHLERYRSDPNNLFTNTLPANFGGFRMSKR